MAEQADVALGTIGACMNDLRSGGWSSTAAAGRQLIDRPALVALWVQAYVEALRPTLKERRLQIRADDKEELVARLAGVLRERGTLGTDRRGCRPPPYALLSRRRDGDLRTGRPAR